MFCKFTSGFCTIQTPTDGSYSKQHKKNKCDIVFIQAPTTKMKRTSTILLLVFFLTDFLSAQKIENINLINTKWFVNNKNENFYKSDTISLIRIEKFNTYKDKINSQYIMIDYNNGNDISLINLKKKGEVDIVNVFVESWSESRFTDKWTWKYDKHKNEMSFYLKRKLHSVFETYSINRDSIISEYGYSGDGTKSKLNLIILNMKRKNNDY